MKSIKIKAQATNSGGKVVGGKSRPVVTTTGLTAITVPTTASPAGPASSPSESAK